jgi:hypothetical protein
MKKLTIVVATLAILVLGAGTALANSIVNGDFTAGNAGFTSAYLYFAQPAVPASGYASPKASLYDEGTYGVGINPALYHASWASVADHTTGAGNMMIVNGDTQSNVQYWAETVTGLTTGQTYYFSAWLTSIYPPPLGSAPTSPAVLAFSLNGVQLGSDITVSQPVGTWNLFYNSFVAAGTTATISVINRNNVAGGNDFAMDDISLDTRVPGVPEPATMLLLGLGLIGLAGVKRKIKK